MRFIKRFIKIFFQILIIFIIFFFLFQYFLKNYHKLYQYQFSLHLWYLIIAIFFFIPCRILGPFIWKRILFFLGINLSYLDAFKICSLSALAKYIPGKIWNLLGRVYLARNNNIPENIVITSQGIEMILMFFSGVIIFLFSLFLGLDNYLIKKTIWILAFIPFLILLLYPPIMQIIINFCSKIFHFRQFVVNLKFYNIIETILLFMFFWIFSGTAFFFLIRSLIVIPKILLPVIIGIYSISSIMGSFSFLTPAGLGVKEGVLSLLLSFYIPLSIAILVSLLERVLTIVIELFRAAIIIIVKRIYQCKIF